MLVKCQKIKIFKFLSINYNLWNIWKTQSGTANIIKCYRYELKLDSCSKMFKIETLWNIITYFKNKGTSSSIV